MVVLQIFTELVDLFLRHPARAVRTQTGELYAKSEYLVTIGCGQVVGVDVGRCTGYIFPPSTGNTDDV